MASQHDHRSHDQGVWLQGESTSRGVCIQGICLHGEGGLHPGGGLHLGSEGSLHGGG